MIIVVILILSLVSLFVRSLLHNRNHMRQYFHHHNYTYLSRDTGTVNTAGMTERTGVTGLSCFTEAILPLLQNGPDDRDMLLVRPFSAFSECVRDWALVRESFFECFGFPK